MHRHQRSGLAVTEAVAIVFILGALTVVLAPTFSGVRAQASRSACADNLRLISFAFDVYANDYNGWAPRHIPIGSPWPASEYALQLLVGTYVENERVFDCPAVADPQALRSEKNPFLYLYDSLKCRRRVPSVAIAADLAPRGDTEANSPNHAGAGQNVLYGDGRVAWHTSPRAGAASVGEKGERDHIWTAGKRIKPFSRAVTDTWLMEMEFAPKTRPDFISRRRGRRRR